MTAYYLEHLLVDEMPIRNDADAHRTLKALVQAHNRLVKLNIRTTTGIEVPIDIYEAPKVSRFVTSEPSPAQCAKCRAPFELADESYRTAKGLIHVKCPPKPLSNREIADARTLMIAWGFVCKCVAPVPDDQCFIVVCKQCKRFIIENEKDEYR